MEGMDYTDFFILFFIRAVPWHPCSPCRFLGLNIKNDTDEHGQDGLHGFFYINFYPCCSVASVLSVLVLGLN